MTLHSPRRRRTGLLVTGAIVAAGTLFVSGAAVAVTAAYGPGAANVVGLTDQTDTFGTITRTLGMKTDTAALSKGAKVASGFAKPGRAVTVTATGFAGDRQAVVVFGDETATVDVIDGKVAASFTAPTAKKPVQVTVTGVQSGIAKKGTVTVR